MDKANWKFMTLPLKKGKCTCCDKPVQFSSGAILVEGDRVFALFGASLAAHDGTREIGLEITMVMEIRGKWASPIPLHGHVTNGQTVTPAIMTIEDSEELDLSLGDRKHY